METSKLPTALPVRGREAPAFTVVHVWEGGSQMGIGLELNPLGLSCMLFEPVPETFTLIVIAGDRYVRCLVDCVAEERVLYEGRRAHRIRCAVADPQSEAWLGIVASLTDVEELRKNGTR